MINEKRLYGFWDRINQACKDSGLSKKEIARRGGFDRTIISHPCSGVMSGVNLFKFCAVTGVSADWLLGLREEL